MRSVNKYKNKTITTQAIDMKFESFIDALDIANCDDNWSDVETSFAKDGYIDMYNEVFGSVIAAKNFIDLWYSMP